MYIKAMRFLRIAFLFVLLAACSSPEVELVLSEQSAVLDCQAQSWATMVTSGGDWTLSANGPYAWIVPSKTRGKMGDLLSFAVQANQARTSRQAVYHIHSGSQSLEISILQEAEKAVSQPATKGAYKHVVILGVDGGGAFFQKTSTPNIDAIFDKGAVTYEWKAVYPTISAQNWGSMLHGVLPEFHRLTNSIVASMPYDPASPYPSIFRVVREAMPEAVLASFCNWDPVNIGIIEDGLGVHKWNGPDDPTVADAVVSYLEEQKPTLLFVHFDSCDGAGHGSGYGSTNHLAAITAVDGLIGRIHQALKDGNMLDNTLLMVVNDHGGTPGGSHGGDTEAETTVFFGAAGKTVDRDTPIVDGDNRDIAAIAAYALGLECPETWTSRVPTGVFWDVTGGEHKEQEIPVSEDRKHETEETPALSEIQKLLSGHEVLAYLPLDGNEADAFGKVTTAISGKLYYYDAYYGQGVALDDGDITLEGISVGTGSFSAAFWLKTGGVSGDPSLLSNKDWNDGYLDGFVFSLREDDIKFNAGGKGGTVRMDVTAPLPIDYKEGWMHVALVVDRKAQQVRLYEDFTLQGQGTIPEALRDVPFDALPLRIGQDGTGTYKHRLPAQLDEFILTADVLTEADIASLKAYYR